MRSGLGLILWRAVVPSLTAATLSNHAAVQGLTIHDGMTVDANGYALNSISVTNRRTGTCAI